jgi:uncharacterized protein
MTAPFSEYGYLGARGVLVVGLFIGVAFGACLERSGLGSARKLMGQFNFRDLAVFKVMFSAIITAMLGLFWLSRLGVLNIERVYLPETFIVPQLVGGLVFGVGFALAGLCPGTSCVAAATGRGDGLAVMIGMFAGVLGGGAALPLIGNFFTSTARGGLTLPSALGVSTGATVLGVVCMALVGFVFAARIERAASVSVVTISDQETAA